MAEDTTKKVVVVDGDETSPEVMVPVVDLLERMNLPIKFERPMIGSAAMAAGLPAFPDATRDAIDASDATFFGSTSGPSTAALFYLRWGKQTYANVRPCEYLPGYQSPLANPDNINFVIIRENLEDLYLGLEGDIDELNALNLYSKHAVKHLKDMAPGKFAIKAITEAGSRRVIRFAFELARKRNDKKRVTLTSKYNMLAVSDGLFRDIGKELSAEYPDVEFETFIVDDFLCRMITDPHRLDVVVTPNLYGDIFSDGAAGLIGGLGLAPSGCYGDDYAYFESAHGTAPDIQGQNSINPTATLLSAAMMLEYLTMDAAATRLRRAVTEAYAEGQYITRDQGGSASTTEFCAAIEERLSP